MKFLILLLYYNRPQMVKNALKSVANQTYTDWQLAFLDDGSELPGEPVVKEILRDSLDKVKFYNTHHSEEQKESQGGSHVGKLMNQAIVDSDADIGIMLCDDDALLSDYLSNLKIWFENNPKRMFCYSNLILFNPFLEDPFALEGNQVLRVQPIRPRGKGVRDLRTRCNSSHSLSRISGEVDSSQVAWKLNCNKVGKCWFPVPKTKHLDSNFYSQLRAAYGSAKFSGFTGQYKGWHHDNLALRPNSIDQYTVKDC